MVPNNLIISNLIFCNRIREPLLLFNNISNDCVKPFRDLRFSLILVLGAGTGCCFFVLGTGIGLYSGIGLASKYCINCRTFLPGVGIGFLLLGTGIGHASPSLPGIGRASSLILTRFWSSLIVIPYNSLLTNSLLLLIILLLYILFLAIAPIIYISHLFNPIWSQSQDQILGKKGVVNSTRPRVTYSNRFHPPIRKR